MASVNASNIPFTDQTRPFWSTVLTCTTLALGVFFVVGLYSRHEIDYQRYQGTKRLYGDEAASKFAKETIQKAISEYL